MHSTPKIRLMPSYSYKQSRERSVAAAGARYGISDDAVASRGAVHSFTVKALGFRWNEREHDSNNNFIHFVFDAKAKIE